MEKWPESFGNNDFPPEWEKILRSRVPFDRFLSEADRRELRRYIRWFLACKRFEGGGGLVVTDEIRVTVAAQACLLLLHRETPCFERLRSIHVYPGHYVTGGRIRTTLGESWDLGVVVLAWDSVRCGAANPFDGDNVVFHEFAHQLDSEDGQTDGIPRLGESTRPSEQAGLYTAWAKMLSEEYEQLQRSTDKGHKTVMDGYGGSKPCEFFAVATECFFEKPRQLLKRHPDLYASLREFYKQDPAAWEW